MQPLKLVLIGASAGGVAALQRLAAGLDPAIPAAWCVALHIDGHRSELPALLERRGALPAQHAVQGERLRAGRIHVAPPDLHFLVSEGSALLSRGPRENRARPAIDPLFRSAAQAHGKDVIGVMLTGRMNDGSAGLLTVRQRGGIVVVQDPADAAYPEMPRSALRHVGADYCVPLDDMAALLNRLALGETPATALSATGS